MVSEVGPCLAPARAWPPKVAEVARSAQRRGLAYGHAPNADRNPADIVRTFSSGPW